MTSKQIVFDNLPQKQKPHVTQNTGNNEWYTPLWLLKSVRNAMGGTIELDPASSEIANSLVQAAQYYTVEDDGLLHSWHCKTLFLNPPYSRGLVGKFTEKLRFEVESGNVGEAILLTNNSTETKWFQHVAERADAICLIDGRVKFWQPDTEELNSPLQGQVLMYFTNGNVPVDTENFAKEFSMWGQVFIPLVDNK